MIFGINNASGKTIDRIEAFTRQARGGSDSLHDKVVVHFTDGTQLDIESRLTRPEGQWYAELSTFLHCETASRRTAQGQTVGEL